MSINVNGKYKKTNPEEMEIERDNGSRPQAELPDEPRQMSVKPTRNDRILDGIIHVVLVVLGIVTFYPLYIVLISSISDPSYISAGQVFLFPRGLNVEAYRKLLQTSEIWVGYRNALFYTVAGTALQMVVTTAAGFALSRRTLPGRRMLIVFFLFTMYFTGGLIPTYFLLKNMGLINTIWVMILPVLVGPYNLIISRNYFENSIPHEIYESATIDGADIFQYYFRFAIPLAVPVLAVMVLNFALGHWNSYFRAMIYLQDDNLQTLQVVVMRITAAATTALESGGVNDPNAEQIIASIRESQLLKYAVVIVSAIPMVCLYPFVQRYFIQGIMIGSVKG